MSNSENESITSIRNEVLPDQIWLVSVMNSITGEFAFPDLPALYISRIRIDLKGVKLITSTGVRAWTIWAQGISGKSRIEVEIVNLPYTFMRMISMFADSIPKGWAVRTFDVPYACQECGELLELNFENKQDLGLELPQAIAVDGPCCGKCGEATEIEVDPKAILSLSRYYKATG